MDAGQWSKGLGVVKSMEEKKTNRPQKPQALNCPRCNSSHTKFCYYNNYNLSQPRYFCKTCRRYWTDGGSLRNVPVGGGSRRNKRSSSSASSSSSLPLPPPAATTISKNHYHPMMAPPISSLITQNPSKSTMIQGQSQSQAQGQDLNLGYTNISLHQYGNLPYNPNTTTTTSSSSQFSSAMELLKSGFCDSREVMMNSLPNTMIMNNNSHVGLNFSLDGFENGGGYHHHHLQLQGGGSGVTNHQSTMSTITTTDGTSANALNARILFPFQDLKPMSTSNSDQLFDATKGKGESSTGYWGGGELGGGGGSW